MADGSITVDAPRTAEAPRAPLTPKNDELARVNAAKNGDNLQQVLNSAGPTEGMAILATEDPGKNLDAAVRGDKPSPLVEDIVRKIDQAHETERRRIQNDWSGELKSTIDPFAGLKTGDNNIPTPLTPVDQAFSEARMDEKGAKDPSIVEEPSGVTPDQHQSVSSSIQHASSLDNPVKMVMGALKEPASHIDTQSGAADVIKKPVDLPPSPITHNGDRANGPIAIVEDAIFEPSQPPEKSISPEPSSPRGDAKAGDLTRIATDIELEEHEKLLQEAQDRRMKEAEQLSKSDPISPPPDSANGPHDELWEKGRKQINPTLEDVRAAEQRYADSEAARLKNAEQEKHLTWKQRREQAAQNIRDRIKSIREASGKVFGSKNEQSKVLSNQEIQEQQRQDALNRLRIQYQGKMFGDGVQPPANIPFEEQLEGYPELKRQYFDEKNGLQDRPTTRQSQPDQQPASPQPTTGNEEQNSIKPTNSSDTEGASTQPEAKSDTANTSKSPSTPEGQSVEPRSIDQQTITPPPTETSTEDPYDLKLQAKIAELRKNSSIELSDAQYVDRAQQILASEGIIPPKAPQLEKTEAPVSPVINDDKEAFRQNLAENPFITDEDRENEFQAKYGEPFHQQVKTEKTSSNETQSGVVPVKSPDVASQAQAERQNQEQAETPVDPVKQLLTAMEVFTKTDVFKGLAKDQQDKFTDALAMMGVAGKESEGPVDKNSPLYLILAALLGVIVSVGFLGSGAAKEAAKS